MTEQTSIACLIRAQVALDSASSILVVKELLDQGAAVAVWAERHGMAEDNRRQLDRFILRAERRLGEMLAEMPKDVGGNPNLPTGDAVLPVVKPPTLASLGITKRLSSEAQKLAKLPAERFSDILAGVLTRKQAMAKDAHIAQNTGVSEWYTPAEYIAAARATMGGIDVDPASCAVANEQIGAATFYTIEDSGLAHEWPGRVWLNPPYAQPLIGQFTAKLIEELDAHRTTAACVLVNNATDTAWFQALLHKVSAVCFTRGRVRFWAPGKIAAPLQGQAVLYFGIDALAFHEGFCRFGEVLP
jgi:phage N-6-adenine-methyltransferase